MARRRIIAGNWKMNMTPSEAVALCATLKDLVANDAVDVVYCVPAIDIVPVAEAVKGTNVHVGAENFYIEDKGAYKGEISAPMLKDAGVEYVIIGHSERRDYFHETDEDINKKAHAIFNNGMTPIVCCGESLETREAGKAEEWVEAQVKAALKDLTAEQVSNLVIAYEPIWAIGTGKTATSDQAEEICAVVRKTVADLYDQDVADKVRIQYGGSVKPANVKELMAKPNIDGGLVGGASLVPESYLELVNFND